MTLMTHILASGCPPVSCPPLSSLQLSPFLSLISSSLFHLFTLICFSLFYSFFFSLPVSLFKFKTSSALVIEIFPFLFCLFSLIFYVSLPSIVSSFTLQTDPALVGKFSTDELYFEDLTITRPKKVSSGILFPKNFLGQVLS